MTIMLFRRMLQKVITMASENSKFNNNRRKHIFWTTFLLPFVFNITAIKSFTIKIFPPAERNIQYFLSSKALENVPRINARVQLFSSRKPTTMGANDLNESQIEAVQCPMNKIVRVLAGPGSGKTRVLTYRIGHLIQTGVAPWSILAVTFTNKAAGEMKERLKDLVDKEVVDKVMVGTFHSVCARLLREFGHFLPDPMNSRYTILDTADVRKLVRDLMKELDYDTNKFKPAAIAACISRIKSTQENPAKCINEEFSIFEAEQAGGIVDKVFPLYQKTIESNNNMDFDDLLVRALDLLQNQSEVRQKLRTRWRQLLVDEWQDTNGLQYDIIQILAKGNPGDPPIEDEERFPRGLLVVGDADQSIYGWRGAKWENVQRLEKDFPNLTSITLKENYRSTVNIVQAAQAIIQESHERIDKRMVAVRGDDGEPIQIVVYSDEDREAAGILNQVRNLQKQKGVLAKDIAVLYRTNAQSRALEQAFVTAGVPYSILGGQRFYERREVKDILLYLRMLNNPQDSMNLQKAMGTPRRGIGDSTIKSFVEWDESDEETSCMTKLLAVIPKPIYHFRIEGKATEVENPDFWPGVDFTKVKNMQPPKTLSQSTKSKLAKFGELVLYLYLEAQRLTVAELIEEIKESVDFSLHVEKISKNPDDREDRMANLEEMQDAVAKYSGQSAAAKGALQAYLEEVSLLTENEEVTKASVKGATRLSTVHAAKGLEFEAVFMVGMEDGTFPLKRSDECKDIEEERRLAYVGVTRAKSYLQLSYRRIKNTYVSGKHGRQTIKNKPSQFLKAVDPHNMAFKSESISSTSRKERATSRLPERPCFVQTVDNSKENYLMKNQNNFPRKRKTPQSFHDDSDSEDQKVVSAKTIVQQALNTGGRLRISTTDLLDSDLPSPLPPTKQKNTVVRSGKRKTKNIPVKVSTTTHMEVKKVQHEESDGDLNLLRGGPNMEPSSRDLLKSLGYQIGVTVMHPVHGDGKIIEVNGDLMNGADDLSATVKFEQGFQIPVPISAITLYR